MSDPQGFGREPASPVDCAPRRQSAFAGSVYGRRSDSSTAALTVSGDEVMVGGPAGGYRLAPQQRRLWRLGQSGNHGVYRTVVVALIEGEIEEASLRKAFNRVIQKNEILRTVFRTAPGADLPTQVIKEYAEPDIAGSHLESLVSEGQVAAFITSMIRDPIEWDLESGTMLRIELARVSSTEALFGLTLPALCSDMISVATILSDVFRAYDTGDDRVEPIDDTMQYADVSDWLNELLENDFGQAGRDFWRSVDLRMLLHEIGIELPASGRFHPDSVTLRASSDLSSGVDAFASNYGVDSASVLLCSWQILLSRLSGIPHGVFGVGSEGRNYEGLDRVKGPLARYIPVSFNLQIESPLVEAMLRTAEVWKTHARWAEFYDWPEANVTNQSDSFFPFIFEFRNRQTLTRGETLAYSIIKEYACGDPFKLKLVCFKTDRSLSLELHYDSAIYEAHDIRRLLQQIVVLLSSMLAHPQDPVHCLELMTAEERIQLVLGSNDTHVDLGNHRCLQDLVLEQVERTPDAVAVAFDDCCVTYRKLNQQADLIALRLTSLGVGLDSCVATLMDRSMGTAAVLFGILKVGAAYIPLDPGLPKDRLSVILQDAVPRVLVTQRHFVNAIPPYQGEILMVGSEGGVGEESEGRPAQYAQKTVSPNGLAYIIYTSGSTGMPKGVMISHRAICNRLLWMHTSMPLSASDRVLQKTSLSFDASIWELFVPLLSGAQVVLGRNDGHRDPSYIVDTIIDREITVLQMVPSMLRPLTEQVRIRECVSLRRMYCGGEVFPCETKERFQRLLNCELFNLFGPTETSIDATYHRCCSNARERSVPIGRPIANTRMYILDGYGEPVAVGVSGELYISGVGLARGYLNGAGLTAEKFIPERFSGEAGGRMYRTGDIGKYGVGGDIEYLGRKDQQVKVRGYRIEMGEIEGALMKHARIEEAVVMMGEGRGGEKRLEAYVVVNGGEELYVNEIRSFLQLKLPEYMVPARYVRLEEMVRLASGKVDRRLVKERGGRNLETEVRYEEGRTARERGLVEIWREVLGVERVGVHDNFFELGGDSIMSIQIVSRANERGIRLTAKEVFRHQTIAELARVETGAERVEGAGAEWVREGEEVKLTPIQRWFFEHGFEEPQHWNQSMMYEVRGGLDTRTLETAIGAVTRHHEALRLRFRREEGEWRQYIEEKEERIGVMEVDLSGGLGGLEGLGGEGVYKELLDRAQGSLNIEAGPLMRVIAFRREAGVYKVLMVVHHLAIDVVSWGILSEDLQAAYESMVGGEPVKLARATTSYAEWSERLERLAQSEEMGIEREYWEKELGRETERLPVDREGENDERSARSVRGLLTEEETDWLMREVPKRYKTRIGEVLLAALGEAIWEWSGKRRVKVDLESHGREALFDDVDLSRTIGWFTSIYPVVLELGEDGGVGARLNRAKDKLRLIRNSGIGYGLLRYITGFRGMDLTQVPSGEVGFNYLGRIDQMVSSSSPLRIAGEATGNPHGPSEKRVHLLEVTAFVWQRQFTVEINYSTNLHYLASVEQLAEEFLSALRDIVNDCRNAPSVDYTPWDFPEAGLDQLELNRLVSEVTEVMKDR